jgi:hypothetical protein
MMNGHVFIGSDRIELLYKLRVLLHAEIQELNFYRFRHNRLLTVIQQYRVSAGSQEKMRDFYAYLRHLREKYS